LISPRYAGAYYLPGVCKNNRGEHAKAIDPLQKAIALLPQFLDPYVELGVAQAKLGQKEEAKKNYLTVLDNPKASSRVLRMLAYRMLEAGWTEESISAYTRLLHGKEPTYGDWNNRGVAYLRMGDLKQAKKDMDQASEVNSSRPEAFSNMGRAYMEYGSYRKAVSSFIKALKIDPSFQPALLNAAVVYGQYLDDMDKAAVYLQRYLDEGGTMQQEMFEGWLAGREKVEEGPPS
jgi:tetratricopeptide (TPR) repeat protein